MDNSTRQIYKIQLPLTVMAYILSHVCSSPLFISSLFLVVDTVTLKQVFLVQFLQDMLWTQ